MRILLTGRRGQVGSELAERLSPLGRLIATERAGLDLLDRIAIRKRLQGEKPEVIVNAAACTAVDRAESEREAAFAVNCHAVEVMAGEAKKLGALLVHFSTDYVFDGGKAAPYTEEDAAAPLNVYGESKLAGERAIAASGCRHLIFRTSWVFAPRGRNFMLAMLAGAREKRALRVVDDQRGAPTAAYAIAAAVARALSAPNLREMPSGVYHLSALGETTWYGFAREIFSRAGLHAAVEPVSSEDYKAIARRPRNSLLDNGKLQRTFGIVLPHWREGLDAVLAAIH